MNKTLMTVALAATTIALLLNRPAKCEEAAAARGKGAGTATHFKFAKTGSLIRRPAGMSKPGPFFPVLKDMRQVEGFPYQYALYFSTDHDRAGGGMWLYVCNGSPTVAANWKSYDRAVADGDFDYIEKKPARNPIFVDATQGRQTETPHTNVIDGTVFMTYHNCGAGHQQSTLLATSPDGVNFTRIHGQADSIILDYDPQKAPGNGHTGYFRWRLNPFPALRHKYLGYSLHGGGDNFHSALWASEDAIRWDKLDVFDSREGHALAKEDHDRIVRWVGIDADSLTDIGNGEYAAICSIGQRSSGGRPRLLELYEIFVAKDGRTLTRESRKILPNGPPGSDDEEELDSPTTVVVGNTWHLIYCGTKGRAGVNTIMGAVGRFDATAPKSKKLR